MALGWLTGMIAGANVSTPEVRFPANGVKPYAHRFSRIILPPQLYLSRDPGIRGIGSAAVPFPVPSEPILPPPASLLPTIYFLPIAPHRVQRAPNGPSAPAAAAPSPTGSPLAGLSSIPLNDNLGAKNYNTQKNKKKHAAAGLVQTSNEYERFKPARNGASRSPCFSDTKCVQSCMCPFNRPPPFREMMHF